MSNSRAAGESIDDETKVSYSAEKKGNIQKIRRRRRRRKHAQGKDTGENRKSVQWSKLKIRKNNQTNKEGEKHNIIL